MKSPRGSPGSKKGGKSSWKHTPSMEDDPRSSMGASSSGEVGEKVWISGSKASKIQKKRFVGLESESEDSDDGISQGVRVVVMMNKDNDGDIIISHIAIHDVDNKPVTTRFEGNPELAECLKLLKLKKKGGGKTKTENVLTHLPYPHNEAYAKNKNSYYVSYGSHLDSRGDAKKWKDQLSEILGSFTSYSALKTEIDEPLMTKNCPVPEDTSEC